MKRFEITVDGLVQPSVYATQGEADAALVDVRTAHPGKNVVAREKAEETRPSAHPHK